MDDVPIAGSGNDPELQEILARFDVPSYVQRALQVEDAYDHLVARCRQQREQWLDMVRTRLGVLKALAGEWERLAPWLADTRQPQLLADLDAELRPELRVPVAR